MLVAAWQHYEELLTADASGDVAAASLLAQHRTDELEHVVAGFMTVFVVDELEVVDVNAITLTGLCSRRRVRTQPLPVRSGRGG